MRTTPRIATLVGLLLCGAATTALAQDPETYTYDALGRLVEKEVTGGANTGEVTSYCYDAAGNRTAVRANSTGASSHCDLGDGATPTPTPTDTGTPTPTPTGSNSGPNTTNDSITGTCNQLALKNVVANDSDPEGNTPIVLLSVTRISGLAIAEVNDSTRVAVEFGPQWDFSEFSYVVRDSLGNTSTGSLMVSTDGCGGGLEPY